jgi:hypothetical protein
VSQHCCRSWVESRNKKDHAFQTWTKHGRNWLKDDLPADLVGARIFVYEYIPYPEKSDQKQRLVKEALQLSNFIDSRRDDQPASESSVLGERGKIETLTLVQGTTSSTAHFYCAQSRKAFGKASKPCPPREGRGAGMA